VTIQNQIIITLEKFKLIYRFHLTGFSLFSHTPAPKVFDEVNKVNPNSPESIGPHILLIECDLSWASE